jgi:DNA-binding IclR family transcriptional regulator
MKLPSRTKEKFSPQQRRYSAPALDKGLDILEFLATERLPLSQLEVAKGLGRTSGEIYRMLMCLAERGYLIREAESGKFRLTLRLYELGHKQNPAMLLRHAARLPMESLAEEIGQACHLGVQYGRSLLTLLERMPTRRICLAVGEGAVFPLIQTNSGKVLLSRMGRDAAVELLENDPLYTAMTEPKRKAFFRMLENIRQADELVSESGLSNGVTDISVPVGIVGTDIFAALTVSYLAGVNSSFIRSAVLRCASQINQNIGMAP